MSIQFTTDQVTMMAPDASSAMAGKKLANEKHWKSLGQSMEALWGECQGSALYQVRVDLATLTIQCSCPSRKQPCKHGLGLLMLVATTPTVIPVAEPPEWIVVWLAKRAAVSKRKEAKETQATQPGSEATASQKKTAEKRLAQVTQGLERLDLWLNDLVRNGLGSLETQPARFWENQAAQMVDAQVPGIASRIRRMATIPHASANWPEKLLGQLGQLALLTEAFHRMEQLDPALQEDVRLMIGWALKEEEVLARGERVTDDWLIVGQVSEEVTRGRIQRTWLLGRESRRSGLVEQFAPTNGAFPTLIPPGACWRAEIAYWPSAAPQRALIAERHGSGLAIEGRLPGAATIEEFLGEVATILACQPWRERFLCVVRDVIPIYDAASEQWYIRDSEGKSLSLVKGEHWELLAVSGGLPLDFTGEWDGEALFPLSMLAESTFYLV